MVLMVWYLCFTIQSKLLKLKPSLFLIYKAVFDASPAILNITPSLFCNTHQTRASVRRIRENGDLTFKAPVQSCRKKNARKQQGIFYDIMKHLPRLALGEKTTGQLEDSDMYWQLALHIYK